MIEHGHSAESVVRKEIPFFEMFDIIWLLFTILCFSIHFDKSHHQHTLFLFKYRRLHLFHLPMVQIRGLLCLPLKKKVQISAHNPVKIYACVMTGVEITSAKLWDFFFGWKMNERNVATDIAYLDVTIYMNYKFWHYNFKLVY